MMSLETTHIGCGGPKPNDARRCSSGTITRLSGTRCGLSGTSSGLSGRGEGLPGRGKGLQVAARNWWRAIRGPTGLSQAVHIKFTNEYRHWGSDYSICRVLIGIGRILGMSFGRLSFGGGLSAEHPVRIN